MPQDDPRPRKPESDRPASRDARRRPDPRPSEPLELPDTYDIVEPVEQEPLTRFDPAKAKQAERERIESGIDLDVNADTAPPPPPSGADYASAEDAAKPRPRLLEGIPEPKFVDPEVKATRREEERVRAAMQLAEEDARRRQLRLKILGTILLVAAVIAVFVFVW